MPSQAARNHSEHLLGRFRELCEELERSDAAGPGLGTQAPVELARPQAVYPEPGVASSTRASVTGR
eukprot:3184252-Prymnesium_polylepis.1